MKVAKILSVLAVAMVFAACGGPAGELVGVTKNGVFMEANPYGMVFIKKGSFMMGENTQSSVFGQTDVPFMTTVNAFWMDETEITNNEYKQFVNWVRDSIAYTLLIGEDGEDSEYAVKSKYESEGDAKPAINWKKRIPWEKYANPDDDVHELLASMFYPDGTLRTLDLRYSYSWMNYDVARLPENKFNVAKGRFPTNAKARVDTSFVTEDGIIVDSTIIRPLREPKDMVTNKIISIYPDTMVWIRDFQFSYNDPLMRGYFSHEGYSEYPVVGVTWEQAHAFCHWRTHIWEAASNVKAHIYRLPTEAEWEYAARGGRKMAMYPWGGNYARDVTGCFLANFKPYRGSYNEDTGTMTMRVAQYRPNDFGLFDMAGNVAEWTSSVYSVKSNTYVNDINSSFDYMARHDDPEVLKRKIVKGGSWKDIYYYLQCGARTYEYQYESRAYIGFRCVRSFVGD